MKLWWLQKHGCRKVCLFNNGYDKCVLLKPISVSLTCCRPIFLDFKWVYESISRSTHTLNRPM